METKARGLGTQVWKREEKWCRNGVVGVQYGGRVGVKISWVADQDLGIMLRAREEVAW